MEQYTLAQWMFFFFVYCFVGWCFESAYVSILSKKFVNRGFLHGTWLPLYGSGALMMLIVAYPMGDNVILIFLAGSIGATVLEYVTGVAMEALFKVRYWDYSDKKFNFQGHICLESSLCWGLLTVVLNLFLHRPVETLSELLPERLLRGIDGFLLLCFVADLVSSFRAAFDLRNLLLKAELARDELERLKRRLDVVAAIANEDLQQRREITARKLEESAERGTARLTQATDRLPETAGLLRQQSEKEAARRTEAAALRTQKRALKREELNSAIEAAFLRIREAMPQSERLSGMKDELLEIRDRYIGNKTVFEEKRESFLKNRRNRHLLNGNPTLTSVRFQETLEEMKREAALYRRSKEDARRKNQEFDQDDAEDDAQ